jgi:hypothetical protein
VYQERDVKQEVHGFRDEALSRRHREWGFDCPAVDIDLLVVEYDSGLPKAIVEYKHERAPLPDMANLHPSYRAIKTLCDWHTTGPLPFFLAYYWPETWSFKVYPMNHAARRYFTEGVWLTEREYVDVLHTIRGRKMPKELWYALDRRLPLEAIPAGGPGC